MNEIYTVLCIQYIFNAALSARKVSIIITTNFMATQVSNKTLAPQLLFAAI